MDCAGEWSDTLRELARGLDEKPINERLDHWPQVYRRNEERLVVFTGRGNGTSDLLRRLLNLRDTESQNGREYIHDDVEAVPSGTRWLDAVPYDAGEDLDRAIRGSDMVVLSVPATSATNKADADLMKYHIVGGAHVPHIRAVITGADDLEPDDLETVTRYVRRTLGEISPRIVVSIEPPAESPNRPAWLADLLAEASASERRHQALAQLTDIAAEVEQAARERAEQADAEARRDDSRLAEAETHAERFLDVASVRRELRARQKAAVDTSSTRVSGDRAGFGTEARQELRGARGDRHRIGEALIRYRERLDAALVEAYRTAAGTVETDTAWLNERLAAYADVWEVAYSDSAPRNLGAAGSVGDLPPLPAVRESWILKKVATPVGKLADIALSVAVDSHRERYRGVESKDLRRGQRVALKVGDKGASEATRMVGDVISDGIIKLADHLESARVVAVAESILLEIGRSLDAERDQLSVGISHAYDALADEFDKARREWREAQRVRTRQRLTDVGDRWRAIAVRARTIKNEIDAEMVAEERD